LIASSAILFFVPESGSGFLLFHVRRGLQAPELSLTLQAGLKSGSKCNGFSL
jgi:hypothetical protein